MHGISGDGKSGYLRLYIHTIIIVLVDCSRIKLRIPLCCIWRPYASEFIPTTFSNVNCFLESFSVDYIATSTRFRSC